MKLDVKIHKLEHTILGDKPKCKVYSYEPKLTNDWNKVTCKLCLKLYNKNESEP